MSRRGTRTRRCATRSAPRCRTPEPHRGSKSRSGSLAAGRRTSQEAVARRVHLAASKAIELYAHVGVVCVEQRMPVTVADLGCRRVESSMSVNSTVADPIIGHVGLLAGGNSAVSWNRRGHAAADARRDPIGFTVASLPSDLRQAHPRTALRSPRTTAVMLSAHCSNVGSAPGVTGSDAPVPAGRRRSVDRAMSSPRPTPEWTVALEDLAAREPVRDEHDVARTFARRAIRFASPRAAHTCLRAHRGSASPARASHRAGCSRVLEVLASVPIC